MPSEAGRRETTVYKCSLGRASLLGKHLTEVVAPTSKKQILKPMVLVHDCSLLFVFATMNCYFLHSIAM